MGIGIVLFTLSFGWTFGKYSGGCAVLGLLMIIVGAVAYAPE
jgi:hypothetical protein